EREQKHERRATETSEQRENCLRQKSECRQKKLEVETPEECEVRLRREREHRQERLEIETVEEREQHLRYQHERISQIREITHQKPNQIFNVVQISEQSSADYLSENDCKLLKNSTIK
ncbi:14908_t:CDS:1, partial [Gigaspora margarita]